MTDRFSIDLSVFYRFLLITAYYSVDSSKFLSSVILLSNEVNDLSICPFHQSNFAVLFCRLLYTAFQIFFFFWQYFFCDTLFELCVSHSLCAIRHEVFYIYSWSDLKDFAFKQYFKDNYLRQKKKIPLLFPYSFLLFIHFIRILELNIFWNLILVWFVAIHSVIVYANFNASIYSSITI